MKNKINYILSAFVITICGFISSCEAEGDVRDGIRPVSFKATTATRNITEGNTITYVDSSLNVLERLWTFEEGSITSSELQTVDVTYPIGTGKSLNNENQLPSYKTKLEVTHFDGTIERGEFLVGIYKQVSVDFEVEEQEVIVGTSTTFTSTIGDLKSLFEESRDKDFIEWTFEGGTPATSKDENPTVTYNEKGTFKVTLTAHRQAPFSEATKSVDAFITVVDPVPVVSAFSTPSVSVAQYSTVLFSDDSQGAPDSWLWTFEGGTPASSTEENPSVTYNTIGTYGVTLQVTRSNDGATDTKTVNNYVTVTEPDPNLIIRAGVDADFISFTGWNLQKTLPEADYSVITTPTSETVLSVQKSNNAFDTDAVFRTAILGDIPAGVYTFKAKFRLVSGDRTKAGPLETRMYLAGYSDAIAFGPPAQIHGVFKMEDWSKTENIGVWQFVEKEITIAAPITDASFKLQVRIGKAHAGSTEVQFDSFSIEAVE